MMIDFACKQFDLDTVIKCSLGMSRSDYAVFSYLLRAGERHACSSEQVAKHFRIDLTTAQRALKRLHGKDLLHRTQQNFEGGGYTFIYSIKNRRHLRKLIGSTVSAWAKKVEDELDRW